MNVKFFLVLLEIVLRRLEQKKKGPESRPNIRLDPPYRDSNQEVLAFRINITYDFFSLFPNLTLVPLRRRPTPCVSRHFLQPLNLINLWESANPGPPLFLSSFPLYAKLLHISNIGPNAKRIVGLGILAL